MSLGCHRGVLPAAGPTLGAGGGRVSGRPATLLRVQRPAGRAAAGGGLQAGWLQGPPGHHHLPLQGQSPAVEIDVVYVKVWISASQTLTIIPP